MKRKILMLTTALLFILCRLNAQTPDTVKAKAIYSFRHTQDTTQRSQQFEEQMVLLLGRNASAYLSMERILQDEKIKKELEEQIKNAEPGKMAFNINRSSAKKLNTAELYQFANEKKLITKMRLVNNYLIEEQLTPIDWKISNETKVIKGLNCQQATAHFKGRDYTAWFCPDLPFQSGPWKLNGLPGLIIEAYDINKEVIFNFESFEEVKNKAPEKELPPQVINGQVFRLSGLGSADLLKAQTISLPKDAIKTTLKEFDKLQEAMRKDPSGFITSSMAGSGVTLGKMVGAPNTSTKIVAAPGSTKTIINNPLELPEKK